jgi:hypothetical protein
MSYLITKQPFWDIIYPDHEITTLQDKIEGKDPEVQWIINDIKSF